MHRRTNIVWKLTATRKLTVTNDKAVTEWPAVGKHRRRCFRKQCTNLWVASQTWFAKVFWVGHERNYFYDTFTLMLSNYWNFIRSLYRFLFTILQLSLFWLLGSQNKANGIIWVAVQNNWENSGYAENCLQCWQCNRKCVCLNLWPWNWTFK
jgi:hypothetical protein